MNKTQAHTSNQIDLPTTTTQNTGSDRRYMALNTRPASLPAQELVKGLTERVAAIKAAKPTKKLESAVGAILGDLASIAGGEPTAHCFRSVGIETFRGQPIGYKPFTLALDGMLRLGLVDRTLGVYRSNGTGYASTFRPSTMLMKTLAEAGLIVGGWQRHFDYLPRPAVVASPVILRAERQPWHGQDRGKALPIDRSDPKPLMIKEQVDRLNAFFATVVIDGGLHQGFHRIFGNGDHPKFDWDMGGRLYSLGGGYQSLPSAERANMRLNGEPVVELDIKASHLTIIKALLGLHDDQSGYEVAGLPRAVVKAWVTMCLGYGDFHSRWSETAISNLAAQGIDLKRDYPLLEVRDRLQRELPIIGKALAEGIGWARLQFIESCAIIDTVDKLARTGIPALPVHDSLIIPFSATESATRVLYNEFRKYVGITPVVVRHSIV